MRWFIVGFVGMFMIGIGLRRILMVVFIVGSNIWRWFCVDNFDFFIFWVFIFWVMVVMRVVMRGFFVLFSWRLVVMVRFRWWVFIMRRRRRRGILVIRRGGWIFWFFFMFYFFEVLFYIFGFVGFNSDIVGMSIMVVLVIVGMFLGGIVRKVMRFFGIFVGGFVFVMWGGFFRVFGSWFIVVLRGRFFWWCCIFIVMSGFGMVVMVRWWFFGIFRFVLVMGWGFMVRWIFMVFFLRVKCIFR